jgi:hypothetical protein
MRHNIELTVLDGSPPGGAADTYARGVPTGLLLASCTEVVLDPFPVPVPPSPPFRTVIDTTGAWPGPFWLLMDTVINKRANAEASNGCTTSAATATNEQTVDKLPGASCDRLIFPVTCTMPDALSIANIYINEMLALFSIIIEPSHTYAIR